MVHWLLVLNVGPLNKCVSVVCTVCLLYLFIQSNLPYKPHPKREYLVVAYENWTTSKGSLPRREQISSTLFCKRIHCMQLLSYDMCSFIGFWYILRSIMHTAITKSDNASSGRLKEVKNNSIRLGGGRLREVPTVRICLGIFWGGRTLRFDCIGF